MAKITQNSNCKDKKDVRTDKQWENRDTLGRGNGNNQTDGRQRGNAKDKSDAMRTGSARDTRDARQRESQELGALSTERGEWCQ